jgi:hypothetical protein
MRMTLRRWRVCVVRSGIALWLLVIPVPGLACSSLDMAWPTRLELATDVFIGRVVASPYRRDADGVVRRDPTTPANLYAVFAVQTRASARHARADR